MQLYNTDIFLLLNQIQYEKCKNTKEIETCPGKRKALVGLKSANKASSTAVRDPTETLMKTLDLSKCIGLNLRVPLLETKQFKVERESGSRLWREMEGRSKEEDELIVEME